MAGDAAAPVLLLAAGEVADDEGPAQLLEGRVALLARPVQDVDVARRGGDPVARRRACPAARSGRRRPPTSCFPKRLWPSTKWSPHIQVSIPFSREVPVDLEDVLGVELARVLAAAARAEGPRPPLVVADVDALRPQHVEVLVEDVEEDRGRTRGSTGSRSPATPCPGPRPRRAGRRRCSRCGRATAPRGRSRGRRDRPTPRGAARRPSRCTPRRRRRRGARRRSAAPSRAGSPRPACPSSRRGRTTRRRCASSRR